MEELSSGRIYPEHIYDPVRIQIATELVEKELAKLMPTSDAVDISKDIKAWWAQPKEFKMGEVVDFWDAVDAVVGGIKLKSIAMMITAANYSWSAAKIDVKNLVLLSKLEQLNRLPGLDDAPIKLTDIERLLERNPAERAEQRRIIDNYSQIAEQDDYRIIGGLSKDGSVRVQDGNRRALRALLHGQPQLDAWIYEDHGQQPRDYWVPVSLMLRLVKMYRHNKENAQLVAGLKTVLAQIFEESSVGKIAYQQRVVGFGVKGAEELLE